MPTGFCPDCDGKITLAPAKAGLLLTCPYCDTQLRVTSAEPLEFDWAYDWRWEVDEEEDEEEGVDEEEL